VDELSARAAEIKAQRAEQDASTQAHLQARRDAKATPEPAAGPAGDFALEAYAGQAKSTASDRRSGLWLSSISGMALSVRVRLWRPADVGQRTDHG
jgi:hypothetical protein